MLRLPRFLLAGLCIATLFLAPVHGQANPSIRWDGEIKVTLVVPGQGDTAGPLAQAPVRIPHPRATGELTSAWTFTFGMREVRRVNVQHNDGTVVGQIVVLNNIAVQPGGRMGPGAVRWSGQASGARTTPCTLAEQCPPDWVGPWTYSYAGDVSGTSSGGSGFIYYSLATQDPMSDLLPNGTYGLTGPAVPQIEMTETITPPPGVRRREAQKSFTSLPPATFNGYHTIGAWDVASVLTAVQQPTPGVVTTAQLREALKKPALGVDDPEPRTVANDSLAGSFVVREPMGDTTPGWAYSWSESWSLRRRRDVKATLTRASSNWRPTLNDTVTVTASLDPAQNLTGQFRFTLFDVSTEKGYAMNAGTETDADLKFADNQAGFDPATKTGDNWQIVTTAAVASADISVQALDYGAWGRLKAEVNIDGTWYDCTPKNGGDAITIPRDEDGNRIADVWESNAGVSGQPADADTDDDPPTATRGDGFTNFEEYRGFMVNGSWLGTLPDTKQLFIYDQLGHGIGYFGKTGIYVYAIKETEYKERVVNFNRGYATRGPQNGIHLHDGPLDPGVLGETRPLGVPNQVVEVVIDLAKHVGADGSVNMPVLMDTLAHELGHAVAIPHHGPYEKGTCGGAPTDLVAVWHGAHGGDMSCVMRYDGANQYKDERGTCHQYVWPLAPGNDFCETTQGTGLNAGPSRVDSGQPVPVSGDGASGGCKTLAKLVN